MVTHYQRLLDYIVPDFVHVLAGGRIVKSGGKELALELEAKGYEWLTGCAAEGSVTPCRARNASTWRRRHAREPVQASASPRRAADVEGRGLALHADGRPCRDSAGAAVPSPGAW